jgi:hypothetical protein
LRERRQIDDHIFESSKGSVQIKIIDVNDKAFGSQGGNNTVDEIFAVIKPAVRVDFSTGYSIWSPPTVNLVRSFSSLWSLMSTTNEPYVTFRPFGISDLRINQIVLVLYSLLSSFAVDLIHFMFVAARRSG